MKGGPVVCLSVARMLWMWFYVSYVPAMDNEVKQRNRRRKRAQRMQAQRHEKEAKDGDSGEDESPVREKPQRPPNRRKKSKEPLVEEDIVDGFAILGFKAYEDLEVSVYSFSLFTPLNQVSDTDVFVVCHSWHVRCDAANSNEHLNTCHKLFILISELFKSNSDRSKELIYLQN